MDVLARSAAEHTGVNKPAVFEIWTKSRPAASWKQTAILPRPPHKRVDHHDNSKVLRIINDLGTRLHWLGLRGPCPLRPGLRNWFFSRLLGPGRSLGEFPAYVKILSNYETWGTS